jgi:hypothetical protein
MLSQLEIREVEADTILTHLASSLRLEILNRLIAGRAGLAVLKPSS